MYWEAGGSAAISISMATAIYLDLYLRRAISGYRGWGVKATESSSVRA